MRHESVAIFGEDVPVAAFLADGFLNVNPVGVGFQVSPARLLPSYPTGGANNPLTFLANTVFSRPSRRTLYVGKIRPVEARRFISREEQGPSII